MGFVCDRWTSAGSDHLRVLGSEDELALVAVGIVVDGWSGIPAAFCVSPGNLSVQHSPSSRGAPSKAVRQSTGAEPERNRSGRDVAKGHGHLLSLETMADHGLGSRRTVHFGLHQSNLRDFLLLFRSLSLGLSGHVWLHHRRAGFGFSADSLGRIVLRRAVLGLSVLHGGARSAQERTSSARAAVDTGTALVVFGSDRVVLVW